MTEYRPRGEGRSKRLFKKSHEKEEKNSVGKGITVKNQIWTVLGLGNQEGNFRGEKGREMSKN